MKKGNILCSRRPPPSVDTVDIEMTSPTAIYRIVSLMRGVAVYNGYPISILSKNHHFFLTLNISHVENAILCRGNTGSSGTISRLESLYKSFFFSIFLSLSVSLSSGYSIRKVGLGMRFED